MGIVFSRFGKFSVLVLLNILQIPFAFTSSPSSTHDSQVWFFDRVGEFLHIPFTGLEFSD
jgi:hypothetical protein